MALEQEKKGGPYSKEERQQRQKEVFRLHFELGYSAIKISDLIKINRNTINADIKYWYSNIKEELKQDGGDFILRQIGRLEAQRSRIIENITENKIDDVRYEKLLLDIDAKINNLLLPISSDKATAESVEIQEDVIKNIILFLIVKYIEDHNLKQGEIISEIVNMQHCTIIEAKAIFSKMENLGLECCKKSDIMYELEYDLLEFAYLRRYVLEDDTFGVNIETIHDLQMKTEKGEMKVHKKYTQEYGRDSGWTDEVFAKYEADKKKETEKHAEKIDEIAAEALKNLPNQKQVQEYTKYIDIAFGEDVKIDLINLE